MNFAVLWKPKAEQALAKVWMDAADRGAITAAARSIDEQLRIDPTNAGESRSDGLRILLAPPLGVKFTVDEPKHRVYVTALWRF
ncbi:MAG: hypothetical protein HY000_24895 [Planctomycetes bacterium]|nr:hypothetical protein [Planctomycetota bacterium]